jgi:hypothetical protein
MNKYPVPIGEIIKKECYVCIGLLDYTWENGGVQASFRKILTADYCGNSYCYL